jgi:hypothetical protein
MTQIIRRSFCRISKPAIKAGWHDVVMAALRAKVPVLSKRRIRKRDISELLGARNFTS